MSRNVTNQVRSFHTAFNSVWITVLNIEETFAETVSSDLFHKFGPELFCLISTWFSTVCIFLKAVGIYVDWVSAILIFCALYLPYWILLEIMLKNFL